MKNPKLKITFMILTFILLAISSILTLIVLTNKGRLTSLIEKKVRKATEMDINIENIHIDLFSGLRINHIILRERDVADPFTLMCGSCTVSYNLLDILKGQIARVSLSDIEISINTELTKPGGSSALPDKKSTKLRIGEMIPHFINIKDISIENAAIEIKSAGSIISVDNINLLINDFHSTGNPNFSLSGRVSFSPSQSVRPSLIGDLTMNGSYNLLEDKLILRDTSHIAINKTPLIKIAGSVRSLTATPEINLTILTDTISMDTIPALLESFGLSPDALPVIKGECNMRLAIRGDLDTLQIESNTSIKDLCIKNERVLFSSKDLELPIVGEISPSAEKEKLIIDGECTINEGQLLIDNEQIMTIDIPIHYSLRYPHTLAVSSHTMKGNLFVDGTPLPINKLISALEINLDLDQPHTIEIGTTLQTKFSDPLFILGTFDKGELEFSNITMKIDDIDCNTLFKTMTKLIPESYREWALNGCLSLKATVNSYDKSKGESRLMSTNISLTGLGFASPDYEYFGEKISGNIKTDITLDSLFNQLSFRTDCFVDPFLIQFGQFTTDMKSRQTRLSLSSEYSPEAKELSHISGKLSWKDVGAFTIDGEILNLPYEPYLDLELAMEDLSLLPLFETFVKDTIQYSHPSLFQAQIEGELNGQFRFSGSLNSGDVHGNINIKKTNLTYKDGSLKGLNLHLPISLTYPTSTKIIHKEDVSDSQFGVFGIKKLTQGPLIINNLKMRPTIISNNFYIKDPLRIPLFGGAIEINDVAIDDIITPDRRVKFVFQLQNINLKNMTNAYKITPLEGTLNSSLIPIEQKNDRLYSKGKMNVNIFDGNITINNLTLNNVFTSLMGVEFSAKINDLNLGKMSTTYQDWGGITGIVNGEIKNFRLVAGEPSSFVIQLKTKKTDKIKQTVSTQFLKKFVPGIGTVLEKFGLTHYKYAVMGLQAILENDYITLQGAVREEGKDLFMKGAGLKKLEIVFYDANKKIQFEKFMNSFKGILSSDFEETQVQF